MDISHQPPDMSSNPTANTSDSDSRADEFLRLEYQALRSQIERHLEVMWKTETFVATGIALWIAWLVQPDHGMAENGVYWLVPSSLCGLYVFRLLGHYHGFMRFGAYVSKIERHFLSRSPDAPQGWETCLWKDMHRNSSIKIALARVIIWALAGLMFVAIAVLAE